MYICTLKTNDMENQLVVLPQEVSVLAEKVATEKREEVNNILNQLFAGTESWKQQNEVQRLKSEFDLEDKLWLKSKQIMQEMFKSLEQEAEYKANTAKRYEIEQKEIRTQERLKKVIVFNPTVSRFDVENLSDEMFNIFLSGLEKEHNDRIEAEQKAEAERIAKEKAEAAERERIRVENERLKKEAELKEKELAAERAKVDQERKIAEAKAQKEREEAAEKLRKEQENAAQEKAKLEAQLREQKDAQERAENEKRIAEAKAQKEADKLAKAPIKKQLDVWVNGFNIQQAPVDNEVSKLITEKFEAFKNWSLQQIENL